MHQRGPNHVHKFHKLVQAAADVATTDQLEAIEKEMLKYGDMQMVISALSQPQIVTAEVVLTHLIGDFYVRTPFREAMDLLLEQLKSSKSAVVVAGLGVVLRLSEKVPHAITPEIESLIRSYRYHSSPLIQWCSGQIIDALNDAPTRS